IVYLIVFTFLVFFLITGLLEEFWRFLLQRNLGNSWLQRLRFAVFGLCDSGYEKYNFVAKKLHKRLLDLGATTIIEKGMGDDQHPSGYEATLDPWMMSLWGTLYQINPKYFRKGPDVVIPLDDLIDQPKYRLLYHKQETREPALMVESDIVESAREMSPGKLSKDKSKPDCFLKMTKNEVLTKAGSTKEVRQFEFQFVSSIKYEVGDVVELLPSQDSLAIDAFIERCDLDPESFITVSSSKRDRAVQAEVSPTAPVMFFFGCRNEDTDFLYRDLWESHAREGGMLSQVKGGGFYTAFSRDQPKKVYVQHKIREMRKEVWDLLCDGAAVYVAGSSKKMPCDVMSALEEIVMEETGGSKETASRWLKALEKAGRYNVEAWS
ncbi:NADPH-dependent diflavin oxidoreductase 1-like, partial [Raphanus sativus]|uniref:NADPH-dependent diflavin oxidoreductase 1-like n=1 Tax=Raphanus sativus TaxID=3726 RepID=A0A9W3BQN1_RAPSA